MNDITYSITIIVGIVAYFVGYWQGAKYTMKVYDQKLDEIFSAKR